MFHDIKILGKQSLIYSIGIILTRGLGFFLIPLYTHYLSPQDYGIMEMLDLTGAIISFFLAMGITNSILRFHSYYKEDKDKKEVISTALIFAIISGIFFILILIRYSDFFSQIIFNSKQYSYFFLLVFTSIYLSQIYTHCKTIFRAKSKPFSFVIISIITSFIAISLNIYFIAIIKIGIKGIYYSSIITFSLLTTILLIRQFIITKISFSINKLSKMLKYGVFFIPTLVLSFIIDASDRYFLKIYTNLEQVGLYALGYKLGRIVMFLIGNPFDQVWSAYAFEIEKKENANEVFSKVLTYYIIISSFVALSLSIFAKEIVSIMASPSFLNAYIVIPFIAFSMIFYSANNIVKIGILIKKKTFYLPIITALVAITNIILNILFIPKYGIVGAALATIISFSIFPLATYYFSNRIYQIQFEFKRLIKIILCVIVLYSTSIFINTDNMIRAIFIKLLILCMFPISLLSIKFFSGTEKEVLLKIFNKIKRPVLSWVYPNINVKGQ